MKWLAALAVLALLPRMADAQGIEQVTVYGSTLAGIWQIESPAWLQVVLFQDPKWGPMHKSFCRIERGQDGYATHCFQQQGRGGRLEVDGTHFHLAWGSMLLRLVLDGEVQSATRFTGHFAAKLMGVPITDAEPSDGTKLTIGQDVPDAGGQAAMLRAIAAGQPVPHAAKLEDDLAAARALGPIRDIAWLGTQGGPGGPKQAPDPAYLSVYAVTFAAGQRLCWLHRNPDGMLEAFACA